MKIFLAVLMLSAVACSHHHKSAKHHHHEKESAHQFEKKCAQAVAEGKTHVEGRDDFRLDHGGKSYYFSSQEMKDKFQKDLDSNISRANQNWEASKK